MPRPALLCAGRRSPRKGAALRGGESGAADQPPSLLGFRTHVLLWLHPTQQPAKLRRHRGGEEQGGRGLPGAAVKPDLPRLPGACSAGVPQLLPLRKAVASTAVEGPLQMSPVFIPQEFSFTDARHPKPSRSPSRPAPAWAAAAQNASLRPTADPRPHYDAHAWGQPSGVHRSDPVAGLHGPAHMRGDTLQLQEDKPTAGALEAAWGPGSVPSPVTGARPWCNARHWPPLPCAPWQDPAATSARAKRQGPAAAAGPALAPSAVTGLHGGTRLQLPPAARWSGCPRPPALLRTSLRQLWGCTAASVPTAGPDPATPCVPETSPHLHTDTRSWPRGRARTPPPLAAPAACPSPSRCTWRC